MDVAGIDESENEVVEIVDFLKDPQKYTRLGGAAPKGVLLIGAPGTGKTLLAITFVPAALPLFIRGRVIPERRHPVNMCLQGLSAPVLVLALRHRMMVVVMVVGLLLSVIPAFQRIGSEFRPPLYEGTILYMPTTFPGLSVTEVPELPRARSPFTVRRKIVVEQRIPVRVRSIIRCTS